MSEVTRILSEVENGDPEAANQLLPLVYDELRKLAAVKLAMEKPGHTLQPTALVHEAYIRLVEAADDTTAADDDRSRRWSSRRHFFGAAAEAMRRILVDAARKRSRIKRGRNFVRGEFYDAEPLVPESHKEVLAVDAALDQFSREDPEKAALVKLRYFGGLTMSEAALALGISLSTAERHWRFARAKLARYVREEK
jgi:RNA polymerase sigma factor (TIGR02999 family)